jgi:hypothetical protein
LIVLLLVVLVGLDGENTTVLGLDTVVVVEALLNALRLILFELEILRRRRMNLLHRVPFLLIELLDVEALGHLNLLGKALSFRRVAGLNCLELADVVRIELGGSSHLLVVIIDILCNLLVILIMAR